MSDDLIKVAAMAAAIGMRQPFKPQPKLSQSSVFRKDRTKTKAARAQNVKRRK